MELNKQQQTVYNWLNDDLSLPVFAEAYKGAATLVSQKSAGYISFIAHAGRDLMNSLAPTVAGIKPGRVHYETHIDQLQNDWRSEWRISDDLSPDIAEKGHFIPASICEKISTIIEDHNAGRERNTEKIGVFFSAFLDYPDKDKIPSNLLSEWRAAQKWFLKHAHLREKPFKAGTDGDLVTHFKCLDSYLYIAASSQYDRLRELDAVLEETNR